MAKHFDKQFKLDAIQYYKEHAEVMNFMASKQRKRGASLV